MTSAIATGHSTAAAVRSARHRVARVLEDGLMAVLLVYLVPVVILAVGAPFALLARLVLEMIERL